MIRNSHCWRFAWGALVLTATLILGCARRQNDIVVGAILPLTGAAAEFGVTARNAYALAADEVNAAGGINGKMVQLLIEDGQSDPKTSLSALEKLRTIDNAHIILTTLSSVSMTLAPVIDRHNILLFTDAAHPALAGASPFLFRHANIANDEAQLLIEYVLTQPPPVRIGLIAVNDDYGNAISEALESSLAANTNAKIVVREIYDKNQSDFRTTAARMLSAQPSLIIVAGYGKQMGLAIRHLDDLGYSGPFLTTVPFIATPSALQAAGSALANVHYLTFVYEDAPTAAHFREMYKQKYGAEPLANAVLDYSIFQLLTDALRKAGSEPHALAAYLRTLHHFDALSGRMNISTNGDIAAQLVLKTFTKDQLKRLLEGQ